MSAQLVLSDREMEVIKLCVLSTYQRTYPPPVLEGGDVKAAERLLEKIVTQLDRPSRRRPRRGV